MMNLNVNSNNITGSSPQQQIQTPIISTSYGGMNAEEKSSYLNQSVISGYIKGISSYIPTSIKSSLKKQISNSPVLDGNDKDTLVGTFFDECEIQYEKHKLLINCYNNGFQVWDLNHVEGVKEILSIRETGLIKFCKVLANPLEQDDPSSNFYGKRPLLAVVSGEDTKHVSKNMVRIFSLQTTELVNIYKFRTPIYNVLSNRQLVLVCLKERIVGFNPLTMSKEISLPCYPSLNTFGVVALGSRWIAFVDYETSHQGAYTVPSSSSGYPPNQQMKYQNQTSYDAAVDVATDLAKETLQKLYYFGDMSRKKVSSYLYSNGTEGGQGGGSGSLDSHDHLSISPSNNSALSSFVQMQTPEVGGVIVVYDFIKQKPVTVIKPPHSQPISYLSFDQSGTLLFSTSTEGTKVNIYRIIPFTNSLVISSPNTFGSSNVGNSHGDSTFRQIYVLKRGITNASVQGISVNETSKWVSLTTSRGTTHIFAINPLGGEVDIHTHITKSPSSKSIHHPVDYYSSSVRNLIPNLLTLNAMDRIKLGNEQSQEDSTGKMVNVSQFSTAGNACFIESDQPNVEKLFVVSPTGQLILFEIRPQKPPPNQDQINENALCLSMSAVSEWDVCRKTRHPEYKAMNTPFTNENLHRVSNYNQLKQLDDDARWLYNVEIVTHSQDIKAVWGIPQFSFRSISSFDPNQSSQTKSFFDIDYPDGEPIKLEKKKSIVSPRPSDQVNGINGGIMDHHHIPSQKNNSNSLDINSHNSGIGAFTNINNDDEDDMEMILKINEAMETSITQMKPMSQTFEDYKPQMGNNVKLSPPNISKINEFSRMNDHLPIPQQPSQQQNSGIEDSVFMKPSLSNNNEKYKKQQQQPPIPTTPTSLLANNDDSQYFNYPSLSSIQSSSPTTVNTNNSTATTTTTTTNSSNSIPIPIPTKKLPPITKASSNIMPDLDDFGTNFSPPSNASNSSTSSSSSSPRLPFSSPPKQAANSGKGKRK
ncbi:hypothetical protein DLAC_09359 [Tieghemostelium lacteum]|uniref:BCAS3 WD40 domain-containing protein n=1 Tax=Tieghemostelium lacteum TaxID=361077 RepID=A0A151Z9T9_TIELA|nr:hypothetical protein DLAC_09359 [Tieghemostelium lacteum]|eukprot:KYQ90722.1 hypothetical protein DLAC_09359 [Tieghemostelium lacteum]